MTAQHTPGPWSFELTPSGGFDIEKDPNDLGRYMVIASRSSHPERKNEMHANARLIAAAPELLAALQEVFVIGDRLVSDVYGHEFVEKARAAIQKATNKEQA
jgi:hypothetical protein